MPKSFANLNFEAPFLVRDGNTLSLHFTAGETQSSMRLDRPDELQVDYTRTMMGFLLLVPRPRHIVMVGLGGGSLAKFCHRFLPAARITVVENNPGVVGLRKEFGVPDDDERLSVVVDDGAAFIRRLQRLADVLLIDGFDRDGQPPRLCSEGFYDDCRRALAPEGVLVVNLHADAAEHVAVAARLSGTFEGNAMQVLAPEKSNCIVFAARDRPVNLQALRSLEWAGVLDPAVQRQLRGEFAHIGWNASELRQTAT